MYSTKCPASTTSLTKARISCWRLLSCVGCMKEIHRTLVFTCSCCRTFIWRCAGSGCPGTSVPYLPTGLCADGTYPVADWCQCGLPPVLSHLSFLHVLSSMLLQTGQQVRKAADHPKPLYKNISWGLWI